MNERCRGSTQSVLLQLRRGRAAPPLEDQQGESQGWAAAEYEGLRNSEEPPAAAERRLRTGDSRATQLPEHEIRQTRAWRRVRRSNPCRWDAAWASAIRSLPCGGGLPTSETRFVSLVVAGIEFSSRRT